VANETSFSHGQIEIRTQALEVGGQPRYLLGFNEALYMWTWKIYIYTHLAQTLNTAIPVGRTVSGASIVTLHLGRTKQFQFQK